MIIGRRIAAALLCVLLIMPAHSALARTKAKEKQEVALGLAYPVLAKSVTLPTGRGPFLYYAQNDPSWKNLIYEKRGAPTKRKFGAGGCNPTCMAMIVANLIEPERLSDIIAHSINAVGYEICDCSIQSYYCIHKAVNGHRLGLTDAEDFLAYMPLVMGSYACGNNNKRQTFRAKARKGGGGTTWDLFEFVASSYGLIFDWTRDPFVMEETLKQGGMAIVLVGGSNQPFSTGLGHYLVIADSDEDYFYFLDPYSVESYTEDKLQIIEYLENGVCRVRKEDMDKIYATRYFMFMSSSAQ